MESRGSVRSAPHALAPLALCPLCVLALCAAAACPVQKYSFIRQAQRPLNMRTSHWKDMSMSSETNKRAEANRTHEQLLTLLLRLLRAYALVAGCPV